MNDQQTEELEAGHFPTTTKQSHHTEIVREDGSPSYNLSTRTCNEKALDPHMVSSLKIAEKASRRNKADFTEQMLAVKP